MTCALSITYYYYTCAFKFEFWMSFANLVSFRTRCKLKKWEMSTEEEGESFQILEMAGQHLMSLEFMSRFCERTPASTIQTIHSTSLNLRQCPSQRICVYWKCPILTKFSQKQVEAYKKRPTFYPCSTVAPAMKAGYYHGALEKPIGGSH